MNTQDLLRKIPSVDSILMEPGFLELMEQYGSMPVKSILQQLLESKRSQILAAEPDTLDAMQDSITSTNIFNDVKISLTNKMQANLRPVINATGTVLHTNLGRAPLAMSALDAIDGIGRGYSSLEYKIKEGKRGSRHDLVENLLTEITGAEAAMVVNNNAAATMIVLASIGSGHEIIVSRGELVEIGGSFRIPEIMEESGAILREVGATNKTKLRDYKRAIVKSDTDKHPSTAALMKVHKSNYDIVGFTEETSLQELRDLSLDTNLPLIYDMGNGLMIDMSEYGIQEPDVPSAIRTGADVVLFSGDKLLGGPQAGIILGRKDLIDKMKTHPLARALRVDKLTFAALEATLRLYLDKDKAINEIPVLHMITESLDVQNDKASRLIAGVNSGLSMQIVETKDQIGGGTTPMLRLDGISLSVSSDKHSIASLERKLRLNSVPIIAHINEDRLLLSMRTIADSEIDIVIEALNQIGKTNE